MYIYGNLKRGRNDTVTTVEQISIVKPTRCTIYQIYFILEQHYMFRTVFPFIIRSLRLYIQHQVYVIQILRLILLVKLMMAYQAETCCWINTRINSCVFAEFIVILVIHNATGMNRLKIWYKSRNM